ncbi:prefoldin subunit 2 [Octopus bimaculoides]|uniref:Prefoldin subunit 2 n=1 Tax=Octopus bimaculoides TaxID=37653 RepID=A0A0L8GB73_OCTBM|nr:prefoldin subunit 2 [Octopus bimaculoides]|eukprot:XP_014782526.1 PREDICTED: prefoldin subunit 2-like [Octopus bimaculoides]
MASTAKSNKPKTNEQIIAGFQELRQQQRALASKISEVEMDLKEHNLVIENLTDVDPGKKCFRMLGGVLVERTVKDVLPAIVNNKQQMSKLIETLNKQLESKGTEINKYRETHNLKIRGEESSEVEKQETKPGTQGVLVS